MTEKEAKDFKKNSMDIVKVYISILLVYAFSISGMGIIVENTTIGIIFLALALVLMVYSQYKYGQAKEKLIEKEQENE